MITLINIGVAIVIVAVIANTLALLTENSNDDPRIER